MTPAAQLKGSTPQGVWAGWPLYAGVCVGSLQVEVPVSPTANGRGGEAPPPWFHQEAFARPDFDADAYIADLRRNVPPPPPFPLSCAPAAAASPVQLHLRSPPWRGTQEKRCRGTSEDHRPRLGLVVLPEVPAHHAQRLRPRPMQSEQRMRASNHLWFLRMAYDKCK